MSYYVVDGDPLAGCALALDDSSEAIEPGQWLSGGLRDLPAEPLSLSARSQPTLPDLDAHLLPLASPRLRALLEAERIDNVQYRPVALTDRGRRLTADYWLMNVLGLVEAVDRGRSEAEPYLGGPGLVLGRFTLDAQRVDGTRLFRLAEAPHLLIADEDLAARLRDLVGVRVRATEDYDGY
jgi:hypothetical protein